MSRYQAELESHIEKYIGPITLRWRNLLVVRALEGRSCHVAITCDGSDAPMPAPKDEWKWAELCALLPLDWPLDTALWESDPNCGWPLYELGRLTRFARGGGADGKAWLGFGHTIPNGDPPQLFTPGTQQCCSFLLPPLELPEKFARLRLEDGEILNFWAIVPITSGELAVKVNQKAPSLIQRLSDKKISDIINPTRPDVFAKSPDAKGLKGWIWGR